MILVRHTKPQISSDICYGSSDVGVDRVGIEQLLLELLPQCRDVKIIYSSPLARCAQLAHELEKATGTEVRIEQRLTEIDFGRWEMQRWDMIPRDELDAWAAEVEQYQVGGAESALQMAQRVSEFYELMVREQHQHGQNCVVICHAGTIRMLLAKNLGLVPFDMASFAARKTTAIAYGEILSVPLRHQVKLFNGSLQ